MAIDDENTFELDILELARRCNLLRFVRGPGTFIEWDAVHRRAFFHTIWDAISQLTRVPTSCDAEQLEKRRKRLEMFYDALDKEYENFVHTFVNEPNMTLPQFSCDQRTKKSLVLPTGGQNAIELDVGFHVPPIQTKLVKDKVFARSAPQNPFPVELAAHHIIPNNVLVTFFNLGRIIMKVEASHMSLRESYVHGVAQANNRMFIAEQLKWRFEKANITLPKYANLETALDYEKFMQRTKRWDDGNLFYGPAQRYRASDPKQDFEFRCARIIGRKRYAEMRNLFEEVLQFNKDLLPLSADVKRSYEIFEQELGERTKRQRFDLFQRARSLIARWNVATCYPSVLPNLIDWFQLPSGTWEIRTEDGQEDYYLGSSAVVGEEKSILGCRVENELNENKIDNQFTPIFKYRWIDHQEDNSKGRLLGFFPDAA